MTHIDGVHRFCYDAIGNMTRRVQDTVTYYQSFNVENRLTVVTESGFAGKTTYFQYDAAVQRVRTELPFDGGITYYPFPGYEEEVKDGVTTRRTTYTIAGQAVTVRVHDVGGSRTRYLPFGSYRTAPTQTFTDRGFTGHLHDDGLGLIYMNARYYVGSIGRFASADTIVPDPTNPQSFNRYSYAFNNSLK